LREAASRIAQLRLAYVPLNGYLKRFRKVDSARCLACGEDEDNVTHFLLNCPSYAHERWTPARHARKKRKALTTKALLRDPGLAVPLAAYIRQQDGSDKKVSTTPLKVVMLQ
jgi:hypothetical protein